jgi:hypothetical protein
MAGLLSFAFGAGLLFVAFHLGQPANEATRMLHNVLALAALLVGTGGGFLALCAGAVLLVSLFVEPRAARRQG